MQSTSLTNVVRLPLKLGMKTSLTTAFLFALGTSVQAADLPAPYISRALDAVLLPVTSEVAAVFGVPKTDGAFVLATQPNGVADMAGVLPGDIVQGVGSLNVYAPIQLDEAVYYLLQQGYTDFDIVGTRSGEQYSSATYVTIESWEETISIVEVSSWESYSYSEFSYEEFYSEYASEMEASYMESSERIEESLSSDEFDQRVTDEDLASEAEAMGDEYIDCPGEIIDGVCVDDAVDDGMVAEEETYVEEEIPAEEEPYVEEEMPAEEDVDYGDDGGDSGGDEEFIE